MESPRNIPEPFEINENAIYPLVWLKERLHGIVELPTLMDRLGLRDKRVFRDALTGHEILDALKKAQPFSEVNNPDTAAISNVMQSGCHAPRKGSADRSPVHKFSSRDRRV